MIKLENYKELPTSQGIYFITNIINQKYYLGRAKNLKRRLSEHSRNYMSSVHLQNSIQKYGKENFVIKITEYPNISTLELKEIEQGLLDTHYGLPLCYNISPFATVEVSLEKIILVMVLHILKKLGRNSRKLRKVRIIHFMVKNFPKNIS